MFASYVSELFSLFLVVFCIFLYKLVVNSFYLFILFFLNFVPTSMNVTDKEKSVRSNSANKCFYKFLVPTRRQVLLGQATRFILAGGVIRKRIDR